MRVCDICGSKIDVKQMVLPNIIDIYAFKDGEVRAKCGDYLEDQEMDICTDCRRHIANLLESLRRQ